MAVRVRVATAPVDRATTTAPVADKARVATAPVVRVIVRVVDIKATVRVEVVAARVAAVPNTAATNATAPVTAASKAPVWKRKTPVS